jgi:vacuolar-type H+-ATPase subunit E/Vma4
MLDLLLQGKEKNQKNKEALLKKTTRLAEKQLQACQKSEAQLQKRLDSLVKFVTNMERVFDAFTEKVKVFYQKKLAAGAPAVANYDALLE